MSLKKMASTVPCVSPFWRQAFVTSGVALNMAQFGLITGYVMSIVPQLQQPGSPIPMDEKTGSWFASIYGVAIVLGNLAIGTIMGKYGRWVASFVSSGFALGGWICILVANNLIWLMIGRILQGVNLGLIVTVAPIMIGEYTSPKHRGFFLTALSAVMSFGTFLVHIISPYLHWRSSALVCTIITFVHLVICLYSPETPSWLAEQGRYDECKKVYRWLRGNNEEEELRKLIETTIEVKSNKMYVDEDKTVNEKIEKIFIQMKVIFKKKEVYKPLIIAIHLTMLAYWCGLCILTAYPNNIVSEIIGNDVNNAVVIATVDLLRIFINISFMYIVKKIKRKTLLLYAVGLNIIIFFLTAGYTYARNNNLLPFDQPVIGIILLYIHMFSIAGGALPLPLIITGEILPLEYRSLIGGIYNTIASLHVFITVKTFPGLVKHLHIYGAYIIYGVICTYSLVVAYMFLPETKDKTLQVIEETFRGRPLKEPDESGQTFLENDVNK